MGLSVMAVFENPDAGLRARRLMDTVKNKLNLDAELDVCFWKFHRLQNPAAKCPAVTAAPHADVIILSAHDGKKWPEAIQEWIPARPTTCIRQPGALVAILDLPRPGDRPQIDCLRSVARGAGLAFYCQFLQQPSAGLRGLSRRNYAVDLQPPRRRLPVAFPDEGRAQIPEVPLIRAQASRCATR